MNKQTVTWEQTSWQCFCILPKKITVGKSAHFGREKLVDVKYLAMFSFFILFNVFVSGNDVEEGKSTATISDRLDSGHTTNVFLIFIKVFLVFHNSASSFLCFYHNLGMDIGEYSLCLSFTIFFSFTFCYEFLTYFFMIFYEFLVSIFY